MACNANRLQGSSPADDVFIHFNAAEHAFRILSFVVNILHFYWSIICLHDSGLSVTFQPVRVPELRMARSSAHYSEKNVDAKAGGFSVFKDKKKDWVCGGAVGWDAGCRVSPIPSSWFGIFHPDNLAYNPFGLGELGSDLSRKYSKGYWPVHQLATAGHFIVKIRIQTAWHPMKVERVAHPAMEVTDVNLYPLLLFCLLIFEFCFKLNLCSAN